MLLLLLSFLLQSLAYAPPQRSVAPEPPLAPEGFVASEGSFASEMPQRLVDLRGFWLFQVGDDPDWANADFPDKNWGEIFVPSIWEDEGFGGYDGYAWYRKHIHVPRLPEGQTIVLDLGRVDDVSAVYINGLFVGVIGSFPPDFRTAYHEWARFTVPRSFLKENDTNIIAVRVFDGQLEGGLREGALGLYAEPSPTPMVLDLAGRWKFRTGDRSSWRAPMFDDTGWDEVTVPGYWELQGYNDYNGFAWYRTSFDASTVRRAKDLVLLLGKIDDLDEVYLNGTLIGATGNMERQHIQGDEWQIVRAYPIPPEVLRYGGENVLAVRIYDGRIGGGFHEGPVGLVQAVDVEQKGTAPEAPSFSLWEFLKNWF